MELKPIAGIVIPIMAFIIGCAGDYGLVKRQTAVDNKMTLAVLKVNFDDYHVYYGKPGGHIPINIFFDPKKDELRLVGDGWYKIEDQQTLSETVSEIHSWYVNHEVMIVEGPDGRFLGYMYCSWGSYHVGVPFTPSGYDVKYTDEHTFHVFQGV